MKRLARDQHKKFADDARLLRIWRKFHAEEKTQVLAGPHGLVLAELFRMLTNLKFVQPSQLIGLTRAIDWSSVDYAARLVVIHEINSSITALREKHNLPPIDDPLPFSDEPESPFRVLREIILTASPSQRGRQPGRSPA